MQQLLVLIGYLRMDGVYLFRIMLLPVLTENFFQDNKEDVEFLLSPEGKQQVIQIHIDGILNYLKTIEL